ncbi:tumor necrosis factor ligand superfamily member 10 [Gastrophryne carolinensis]
MQFAPGSNSLPLCGFLLVSVIVQAGFLVFTYIYFTHEIKQLHENYIRNNIVCLVGEDLEDVLQPVDDKDKNDPCWAVRTQVQILVKKIIVGKYRPDITEMINEKLSEILPGAAADKLTSSRQLIAAHFTGNSMKTREPENPQKRYNGHKITEWHGKTISPSSNHIKLKDGELIIPEGGHYYIYAQTYFRHTQPEQGKSKQLVQYIYKRTTYADPIELMKNVKTTCWSTNIQHELNSIYQGGVFHLTKGDRIFVSASDVNIVAMDETGTYFGAFRVF